MKAFMLLFIPKAKNNKDQIILEKFTKISYKTICYIISNKYLTEEKTDHKFLLYKEEQIETVNTIQQFL